MLATAQAPSAVFAAQQRLHRQAVALVVFGDFPMAELMTPPTTVVDQRPSTLAENAFNHLVRRLEHPEAEVAGPVVPTILVPRGSGELAPRGSST